MNRTPAIPPAADADESKAAAVPPQEPTSVDSVPDRSVFTHTPCYCEENVYLLCKKLCSLGLADQGGRDLFAVFISNDNKQVPLWHQKASRRDDSLVIWDYHVICIQMKGEGSSARCFVWDLDSSLPFPSSLSLYVDLAIRPSLPINEQFTRFFRVVHAPVFLNFFASDRHHMKDRLGNWLSLPPAYGPIVAADGTMHNLDKYMQIRSNDMVNNVEAAIASIFIDKFGVVVDQFIFQKLLHTVLNGTSRIVDNNSEVCPSTLVS